MNEIIIKVSTGEIKLKIWEKSHFAANKALIMKNKVRNKEIVIL